MPDCEQTSEQLHVVVSLSAGIGDPAHLQNSNAVSPVYKLKEALSSKEAYCKYYLVSISLIVLQHSETDPEPHFTTLLLGRSRNTGSAISWYGTTIEQHCSRKKWGEGGREEYKVETRYQKKLEKP